ncbi:MAG: GNAT family N-acetyltransferase [Caldilineaceae bacterium]|nr:GNAT family N-acetyltransferase [Caldilineaceae bacterium]
MMIKFVNPGTLVDGELELVLVENYAGNARLNFAPAYRFKMVNTYDGREMGRIDLRVGNMEDLRMYAGHIGYRVKEAYRGRRYAARAVRLLLPLARHHQLGTLWITCNPENMASRRTCELAGLTLVEIVKLPPDNDMYHRGDREKCRYQLAL